MKVIKARCSGFAESAYDMSSKIDRDGNAGPVGTSRKISVADGPEQDKISLPEELWVTLTEAERAIFPTLGLDNFGSIIVATFSRGDGVKGYKCSGLRIENPYTGELLIDRLPAAVSDMFGALVG